MTSYPVSFGWTSPARNRVVRRIRMSQAYGLVGAFGSVWATGADGLIRIDPSAGTVTARIPLVGGGGWTAATPDAVWVTTRTGVDSGRRQRPPAAHFSSVRRILSPV